jgi:Phage capsid family
MDGKTGREVSPLALPEPALKALYDAQESGQSIRVKAAFQPETKAFSTVDPLLPPTLQPGIVEQIHEWRLLDHLPTQAISTPSLEYIKHTSSTGTPGTVQEGQLKPDVTINVRPRCERVQARGHVRNQPRERPRLPCFYRLCPWEMFRQLQDLENAQLISGNGVAPNLTGILNTSGILTYAYSSGSQIDAIEQGIQLLRVGAALAVPDILVVNPNTLGGLRRLKDAVARYYLQPDLAAGEIGSLWGVRILETTACPAGTGILIDSEKMGLAVIREGVTVTTGTTNDDFSRNIVRYVIEERIGLAIERPAAICSVTGLPLS